MRNIRKRIHRFRVHVSQVEMSYDEKERVFEMRITNFPSGYVTEILGFLLTILYKDYNPTPVKTEIIFDGEEKNE